MTDEKYVRARWERIALEWGTIEHKRYVSVSAIGWMFIPPHGYETEAEAWSGARAFTEQREREIAEVEKEIVLIENAMKIHRHNVSVGRKVCQHVKAICRWSRILARLQAVLAELRRGMKEGASDERR